MSEPRKKLDRGWLGQKLEEIAKSKSGNRFDDYTVFFESLDDVNRAVAFRMLEEVNGVYDFDSAECVSDFNRELLDYLSSW